MVNFEDQIERILAGMTAPRRPPRGAGTVAGRESLDERVAVLEVRLAATQDAIRHIAKTIRRG